MRRTVEEDLGGSGIVVPSLGDYGSPDSYSDPVRSPDDGRQRLLERDGGGCIFEVGDQLANELTHSDLDFVVDNDSTRLGVGTLPNGYIRSSPLPRLAVPRDSRVPTYRAQTACIHV